jgi:hypothetical protein
MENGTGFFKISPKSAHAVLDSIPLGPHHGYGPPTTDGRQSASGRLKPTPWGWRTQRRKRGSGGVAPVGRGYANTAFRTASHRRRHAHRAGGSSGSGWSTPRFLYGLRPFGPPHAMTSWANGHEKPAHQSAQPASSYCGSLTTTPRAETWPSRPTGRRHFAGHFGRLGQIKPPEQASRPLIPFRFTN